MRLEWGLAGFIELAFGEASCDWHPFASSPFRQKPLLQVEAALGDRRHAPLLTAPRIIRRIRFIDEQLVSAPANTNVAKTSVSPGESPVRAWTVIGDRSADLPDVVVDGGSIHSTTKARTPQGIPEG